ncbi:MAG: MBL fold metallo-hydrolase [Parcubacteria group bacterium]
MKLKFCGADQEVTGSCHLVETNGKKILLDCGMYQGGGTRDDIRKKNETFQFDPASIDILILSHAHIDHTGLVPRLVKQGFTGKIYSTPATRDVAEALLLDSAHIQLQDAAYIEKEFTKKIEPLYTDTDVESAMELFETAEYLQKIKISDDVWLTFFDAGHVLGSALIALDITEDNQTKRLLFTGDLGRKYAPILNNPYQVDHADILITESTYAGHVHDSIQGVQAEMTQLINKVVARGGKIIVPGFSFERTQEIVYVLHRLYDANKIPKLPIFVDSPLSVRISEVFSKYKDDYDLEAHRDFIDKKEDPFYFKQIKYIESVDESKALNGFKGSCIIISASGMCESGRIKHHLKNNITDSRNLILVVGFMAVGTRGRNIVDGKEEINIFGQMYPLKAEVAIMNAFSGHADKVELLEYIKNIDGLQKIFVVHGEKDATEIMKDNLARIIKFSGEVVTPEIGQSFEV